MPAKVKRASAGRDEDEKKPAEAPQVPENWPEGVTYLTDQTYSAAVTAEQRVALSRTNGDDATWLKVPAGQIEAPSSMVHIPIIENKDHPACGQRGLFAAKHLEPDAFVCLYLGHVHTNSLSDTDPRSDYDLNLDGEIGLSVDAARSGNESRCCNDYRGIADRPNAEFRDCFIQVPCVKRKAGVKWERRVGIFVLGAGNAGKRKKGIADGEEILVSYGKGYWEGRKTVATFRKDEVMLKLAQLALDA